MSDFKTLKNRIKVLEEDKAFHIEAIKKLDDTKNELLSKNEVLRLKLENLQGQFIEMEKLAADNIAYNGRLVNERSILMTKYLDMKNRADDLENRNRFLEGPNKSLIQQQLKLNLTPDEKIN